MSEQIATLLDVNKQQRLILADIIYGEQLRHAQDQIRELKYQHRLLYEHAAIIPNGIGEQTCQQFDLSKRQKIQFLEQNRLFADDLDLKHLTHKFKQVYEDLNERVQESVELKEVLDEMLVTAAVIGDKTEDKNLKQLVGELSGLGGQ